MLIDSHNKNWVEAVCEEGLGLHLVLSAHETPPWFQDLFADHSSTFEKAFRHDTCHNLDEVINTPSLAHSASWEMTVDYFREATKALVAKYGDCVFAISPTLNSELETRYTQTFSAMRDYSDSMLLEFEVGRKLAAFGHLLLFHILATASAAP